MRRIFSIFLPLLLIPFFSFCQTSSDCSAVTIISATNYGTNTVATYLESDGIRNGDDYFGSTIYYPQNTTSILASIIIIPGYNTFESSMQNWGPFLASHGIVCMTIGTNSIWDLVNTRKEALQDALISLKAENTRINSPLFNELDTNRVALGGWSMGGGGAQLAAVEDSTIKAIIALCPWIDPAQASSFLLNQTVPIILFSGQIDAIAPPNTHANAHYNYTPNTTDKLIYEISLGGHTAANGPSGGQGEVGRMALSWLKKYLIEDSCHCPLLLDTPVTASVYQTNITCPIYGCIDPTACNYDPLADFDDGSCEWTSCVGVCAEDAPTGLNATNVVQNRATINWDNMNDANCMVDQYRISYSDDGGATWSSKTMGQPVNSCLWAANNTDKLILNLTPSTTYTYRMKAWYCGGGNSSWSAIETFTTLDDCPNVGNLIVTTPSTTKATFTWDDSNGAYSFTRIKSRVDTNNGVWFNIGGSGVAYGIFTKDKNNLFPGTSYRAQARTWCDPNGGAYKSPTWTPLIYWTMPTVIRLEGGSAINNLAIYPNPSRDIFNVTFTSEEAQDLKVRILNLIGEELINEDLQQFIGEYTKQINLSNNAKGMYFLEIEINNGVINKKLILL